MRHSRRAVMAEQYKLYMKRNVLNGRYFVRNIQIILGFVITLAVIVGAAFLIKNNASDSVGDTTTINAKDALFGNSDVTETEIAAKNTESSDNNTESSTEQKVLDTKPSEDTDITVSAVTEISATIDAIASDVESEDSDDAADEKDTEIELVNAVTETGAAEVNADTLPDGADNEEDKGEFADRCIANVEETLNVRKEPSRDAEFVGMMDKGSIARVIDTEGEWTKIKSGDVEGYVLSEYVLTGESAEEFAEDYVIIQGTALEDGVNVRDDRSTDAGILKVLEKDDKISVLEIPDEDESVKSDDITWITIMLEDGQIGYVSQDYVDVDKLYTLAVSAEELQRREEERAAAERAAAEAAMLAASQTAASSPASSNNSSTYKGAKTTPVTAASSGESLGTFYITAYCGCDKCSSGHNKTASGTTPTEGRTIAADTSVLPFGTQVVIDGIVYTVEDRGSGVSGNHIDIFFATHEDAMAYGSKSATVYKY